jgi:phage-related protein
MTPEKEIRWVGSAYDDLLEFPEEPRRDASFQLSKVQSGLDPENWKPFGEVGAGAREIRIRDSSGIFRVMYSQVRGSGICPALLPEKDPDNQQAG